MTKTQTLIAAAALFQPLTLKQGDKLVWKDGMCNKRSPEIGQPMIVSQVYTTPRQGDPEPGSQYATEIIDFAAVFIDDGDGDFMEYEYDSRRFRHATMEDLQAWDKE